jgi:DNA-binding cell septation regulator SpoVG
MAGAMSAKAKGARNEGVVTMKFTICNWKALEKNTLRGFFTVTLPSGLVIHNCSLHEKDGGRWIGMPSEKYTKDGQTAYKKLVEFKDRAAQDAFRDACLDALDELRGSYGESSPAPRSQHSRPAEGSPDWLR